MKCPVCNIDLLMGERLTVQIDYCPQCRGIWLSGGKLENIIEESSVQISDKKYREKNKRDREDDEDYDEHGRKKRRSFWDIFD